MKVLTTAALCMVLVLSVPSGAWSAEEDSSPAVAMFSGSWVLNKEASDNIAEVMSRTGSKRGSGGGMGGRRGGGMGGGRGGGMGGGRGGGMGNRQAPSGDTAQMQLRRQKEISRLDIFTDGNELNITNGLDISRLLYCDGREVTIWTAQGETLAHAAWADGRITETWSHGKQPARSFTYSLSEDGNRLTVVEQRTPPHGGQPITLRMVYDREQVPGRE